MIEQPFSSLQPSNHSYSVTNIKNSVVYNLVIHYNLFKTPKFCPYCTLNQWYFNGSDVPVAPFNKS